MRNTALLQCCLLCFQIVEWPYVNRLRGGSGTFYKQVSDCVHQCHCKNCGTHGMSAPGSGVLSLKVCCFFKVLVYVIILLKKVLVLGFLPSKSEVIHPSVIIFIMLLLSPSLLEPQAEMSRLAWKKHTTRNQFCSHYTVPFRCLQMWTHQGRDLELTQNAAFISPFPHSRAWHLIIA